MRSEHWAISSEGKTSNVQERWEAHPRCTRLPVPSCCHLRCGPVMKQAHLQDAHWRQVAAVEVEGMRKACRLLKSRCEAKTAAATSPSGASAIEDDCLIDVSMLLAA